MPSMTFRFTTECEVTLEGNSYEDIYLEFKEFMHGRQLLRGVRDTTVFPPETVQVFFNTDRDAEFREIPAFKGDFRTDIRDHSRADALSH